MRAKIMKVVISSGHGTKIRGARGNPVPPELDEVDEAIRVKDQVAAELRKYGVDVVTFTDTVSDDQDENLRRICDFHNAQGPHDWDISVHFNATEGAYGTEVFSLASHKSKGAEVSAAIAVAGGFKN